MTPEERRKAKKTIIYGLLLFGTGLFTMLMILYMAITLPLQLLAWLLGNNTWSETYPWKLVTGSLD